MVTGLRRGDSWDVRCVATGSMTATAADFHVTTTLEAHVGGSPAWARTWTFSVPRDNT
jgi:hypothetical protein